MADTAPPDLASLDVAIDPDFEPQKRPRSCTWPLPESSSAKPGLADTDIIPEEEDDEDDSAMAINGEETEDRASPSLAADGQHGSGGQESAGSPLASRSPAAGSSKAGGGGGQQTPRKSSSRRNAWGNLSYADLITKAIESTPDKRLTLSQIYDWMVRSVPYFKDKGDSNSSAGWKNSIRHNLSLHSRFMRMQNEGTGKSSWWIINPEGGRGGKAPRRRAVSMDNGNNKLAKSARGRAAKKKAAVQAAQEAGSAAEGGVSAVSSSLSRWSGSPREASLLGNSSEELDAACWTDFRSRTNSNASTLSLSANPEPDEVADDDDDEAPPLSPMLYSSPSSLSPPSSSSSSSSKPPLPAESPRLAELDLAGTTNLNDGLTDSLMDQLLDNISLAPPAAVQAGRGGAPYSPSFGAKATGSASSPGSSPSSPGGFGGLVFGPTAAGRQTPMQTIQENKQTSFSSISRFGNATLQELLLTSDPLGPGHSHSDVMMSQSDPLISQASAAATSSSHASRLLRNGLLRSDPMMSSFSANGSGHQLLQNQQQQQPQSSVQQGASPRRLPTHGALSLANDANNLASAKQRLQGLTQSSVLLGDASLFSGLNGGGVGGIWGGSPSLLGGGMGLTDRFPADLDLDMFSGSLECDVDSIIRSELMDADGLDFNFDLALVSAQNSVNLNPVAGGNLNPVAVAMGNFGGVSKPGSWVPG